jgi:hypothetical protein
LLLLLLLLAGLLEARAPLLLTDGDELGARFQPVVVAAAAAAVLWGGLRCELLLQLLPRLPGLHRRQPLTVKWCCRGGSPTAAAGSLLLLGPLLLGDLLLQLLKECGWWWALLCRRL